MELIHLTIWPLLAGLAMLYIPSYQGAQYTSTVVTLTSKPVQQVNLTVYEATTSTADIAIVRATVLLREPDAQKGLVSVSELFIFRNLNAHTYVGSLDASQGKPNALLFTLPHTARNVSLGKGFDGYTAIQVNSGFASDAAVPPGDSQFAFTFDMPYTISSYDFDYTVQYPTVQLMMLIPLGHSRQLKCTVSAGTSYRQSATAGPVPGDRFDGQPGDPRSIRWIASRYADSRWCQYAHELQYALVHYSIGCDGCNFAWHMAALSLHAPHRNHCDQQKKRATYTTKSSAS